MPEKFLNMEPRPTIKELVQVINASPLGRIDNVPSVRRTMNLAPDPDRPGHLKWDTSAWIPDPG